MKKVKSKNIKKQIPTGLHASVDYIEPLLDKLKELQGLIEKMDLIQNSADGEKKSEIVHSIVEVLSTRNNHHQVSIASHLLREILDYTYKKERVTTTVKKFTAKLYDKGCINKSDLKELVQKIKNTKLKYIAPDKFEWTGEMTNDEREELRKLSDHPYWSRIVFDIDDNCGTTLTVTVENQKKLENFLQREKDKLDIFESQIPSLLDDFKKLKKRFQEPTHDPAQFYKIGREINNSKPVITNDLKLQYIEFKQAIDAAVEFYGIFKLNPIGKLYLIDTIIKSNNVNLQNKVERILTAIGDDQVAKHYFYTKPNLDETWFDALNSAGVFDIKPVSLIKKVGDQIEYYRWVEAVYLIKVTPKIPNEILALLKGYDTSSVKNPIIKEKLIEIVCILVQELTESSIKELVSKVSKEKWFESRYLNLMVYKLEDLVKVLCEKKYYGTLIELLPGILKLQKPSEDSKYRHDPIPLFESYTYQEILNHLAKLKFGVKQKAKFKKILTLIINLLQDHIQIDNNMRSYRKRDDDTSVVWKPEIGSTEPDPHKDLDESLLDVARDLILLNIDLIDMDLVEKVISKNKYTVFKRLALFTIVQVEFKSEDVFKLIESWVNLEDITTELRKVLEINFKKFTSNQKDKILSQIENMYDLDKLVEEKKFLLEGGRTKDEQDLRRQLTAYATRKKSEYLLPIAKDLPSKNKEHFKEVLILKDDYKPPYSSSKGGFRSGPNSRLSIEEIKSSSIAELVKKFKDDAVWFIDHTRSEGMYSPLGVARAWDPDIKVRPEEYLNNLQYFKPDKLLPPVYIYHLFNGFEASLREKKVDLTKLMSFLNDLLQQYKDKTLPEFPVKDDFDDIGDWDEVLIAILGFFDDTLQIKGAIKAEDEQTVLSFIEFCLNYRSESEIKDEEERYFSKDYYTYSINSLYGLALHCSVRHATWRVLEEISKQSLTDDMKKLIKEQLNRKIKTAFSVYGHYYPTIFYYDRPFGKKIKSVIFDNKDDVLKYAAFESYLFNNVYKEIVDEISDSYGELLTNINNIPKSEQGRNIQEKLVEHVMISYVHELPGADKLKEKLFQQEDEYREHAISFIGRAYVSAERKKPSQAVINKIKSLWEESLIDQKLTYGKAFGWWLNSSFFNDDTWMLDMFIKTLKKTKGVIDPDFKVLRSLADLSKSFPEKCLNALFRIVVGKNKEKTNYFRDKEVLEIIKNGEAKNEPQFNEIGKKIRIELVEHGFLQYK